MRVQSLLQASIVTRDRSCRHGLKLRRSGLLAVLMAAFALVHTLPSTAHQPENYPDIVETVSGAIVSVTATRAGEKKQTAKPATPTPVQPRNGPFQELFREFMKSTAGDDTGGGKTEIGSGVIVDPSGVIVTAAHIIDKAIRVSVTLASGETLAATILGRDAKTNIAVLKIDTATPLPSLVYRDTKTLRIGEPVLSFGRLKRAEIAVATGIVSGLKRDIGAGPYDDYVQSDAFFGGSMGGGALVDMQGRLIGISASMISPDRRWIGIGFSIPASKLEPVVEQIRRLGRVDRAWLGVRVQAVTAEIAKSFGLDSPRGALVAGVIKGSPAEIDGIKAADVILKIDGVDVVDTRYLVSVLAAKSPNTKVVFELLRDGRMITLAVTLGAQDTVAKPAEIPAPATADDGSNMSVTDIQRNLEALGYGPGATDGRLGRKTREAIRLFQGDNGLPVDGQVTPELGRAIRKAMGG